MTPLIEKFIHYKLQNTEIINETDGNILGLRNGYRFFLFDKKNDILYFNFSDFNTIKESFEISDFRCVKHIKDYFRDRLEIPFSVFLPILGTGIYWYDLESYV